MHSFQYTHRYARLYRFDNTTWTKRLAKATTIQEALSTGTANDEDPS